MNIINYINHKLYIPPIFHRRFDLDLSSRFDIKRYLLVALPFISLYRPAGWVLSLGMNSSRIFSHLTEAFHAEGEHQYLQSAGETAKAGIAAIALATLLFNSPLALCITNGYDTLHGLCATLFRLKNRQLDQKTAEETLQTAASALYLAFIVSGSLELMVAFALFNVALSLLQAKGEWAEGHYIECLSKIAFGGIRGMQGIETFKQVQRRNELLKLQKTAALFEKIFRGKEATHLIYHPLSFLKERIETNEVVLSDAEGTQTRWGSHMHGAGQTLVKGENLAFRTVVVNGKEMVELDFKINHAFRQKLDEAIKQISSHSHKELKEIFALSGSHCQGINISKDSFFHDFRSDFYGGDLSAATKIEMEGLGSILVGTLQDSPNLYDRVVIHINADQTLFQLHEMLSLLNLDQALRLSSAEDFERLKMGHLFRNFFPREATPFERTEEFFTIPIDQLKAKMVQLAPEMDEIFDAYLKQMTEEQIFDGRIRYRMAGLASQAYAAGARALTAAITGVHDDENLFSRVASILKMGLISTETRMENQFDQHGLGGGGLDFLSGGADSVYTQLVTKTMCDREINFDQFHYQSKVRLIISLDALELGTYQYHTDNLGSRTITPLWWFFENYQQREGILEFIQNEQAVEQGFNAGNEVMLKERLAPSFIKALVVPDSETKVQLLAYLKQHDVSVRDDFVRIGSQVSEEILS